MQLALDGHRLGLRRESHFQSSIDSIELPTLVPSDRDLGGLVYQYAGWLTAKNHGSTPAQAARRLQKRARGAFPLGKQRRVNDFYWPSLCRKPLPGEQAKPSAAQSARIKSWDVRFSAPPLVARLWRWILSGEDTGMACLSQKRLHMAVAALTPPSSHHSSRWVESVARRSL